MIPNIFQLAFNNLSSNRGNLDGNIYNFSDVVEEILRKTAYKASKLMKLKLTKMNLRHEGITNLICETMGINENMISPGLSFV